MENNNFVGDGVSLFLIYPYFYLRLIVPRCLHFSEVVRQHKFHRFSVRLSKYWYQSNFFYNLQTAPVCHLSET